MKVILEFDLEEGQDKTAHLRFVKAVEQGYKDFEDLKANSKFLNNKKQQDDGKTL